MRAIVSTSAKIGFGSPYELNHRELVPFRHDRRCVADFEVLTLACFKQLLGETEEISGRGCGLYFAGAKDTLQLDVDFSNELFDADDRVNALTTMSEGLNPLLPLNKLYNIGLYLAAKEGIECWRHCQYTNHKHADYSALAAAVRDVCSGTVEVGFAVFARASGGFELPQESIGAVGVRVVACNEAGDRTSDAVELSARPQPELLLELQRLHADGGGAELAVELPDGTC
ncbi:MAG: hypothetical protein F4X48_06605 [Acidimicrobiia bacterium]|nr:hypothetical protein [Acidimicrobiia bacterium]MYC58226.1 hypothetical protein [Acidimicrobiia bacterium]MYI30303.1 hypothetical protein [Acidimicrobiia bacterium]